MTNKEFNEHDALMFKDIKELFLIAQSYLIKVQTKISALILKHHEEYERYEAHGQGD